ncbi:MAG: hypothetical protein ACR2KN_03695 [Geodermatophilaceae bacterium]
MSGGAISGATQVSFNPPGSVLVVTEKQSNTISSYTVDAAGVASRPIANQNAGGSVGPFGFTYTRTGKLLTAQNFGGAAGQGGAASFNVAKNGTLTPITPTTVKNGQSDTCWFVLTDNQRFGFLTNAQSNDISSYRVGPDGELTLLQGDAAHTDEVFPAVGPTILPGDLTLSRDSRYLHERNVMDGDVNAYAVGADGHLTLIQRLNNALPNGAHRGGRKLASTLVVALRPSRRRCRRLDRRGPRGAPAPAVQTFAICYLSLLWSQGRVSWCTQTRHPATLGASRTSGRRAGPAVP